MSDKILFPENNEYIEPINIIDEMQRSYLDYAMSVIVSRALPDVRDGFKPVHRRILYAMSDMGLSWNKAYRKSAGVVGEVMGKYHPHGDSSIYEAMVRMAQDFSLRNPLIDGQGNFGSIDGDPAAAMRYTECRLEKISETLLADLDKETVDFQVNYDGREKEPVVLPARFPNLLVNGSGGIAVGMATNIPPHNLSEVINGCIALIDNPDISLSEIMSFIKGPDFPTGALILGTSGIRSAYETGRGTITVRAKLHIETICNDRKAIIITEIPYQVNKAAMIEKIADLMREKRIEGIADLRDESDRDGYRVVIELKRGVVVNVILNQLYRYTPLQSTFSCNMVALNDGRPKQMGLLDILRAFVSFREEIVVRRTKYLLRKARDCAHILVGLAITVSNIDKIIDLIRHASDSTAARLELVNHHWLATDIISLVSLIDDPHSPIQKGNIYTLSDKQAHAILDFRLQKLTALGRDEIVGELHTLSVEIDDYLKILASRQQIMTTVKNELIDLYNDFSTPRLTAFGFADTADINDEDLIAQEDMVITVSHAGYIKRVPLSTYRAQRRGGKGRTCMATKEEDFVTRLFVANTHQMILFFSSRGLVYREKVWRVSLGTPQSRGKALVNMLPLQKGERITSIMPLPEDKNQWNKLDILFATTRGTVRRNRLADCVPSNRNGKIAMKLAEKNKDEILSVETCTEKNDILLTTALGQSIRFSVSDLRVFSSRNSVGTRCIKLAKDDTVISMAILSHVEATSAERIAYNKRSLAERRALLLNADHISDVNNDENDENMDEEETEETCLDDERYEELKEREQMILIINEFGYGKRSSSYDFRIVGRGGKGIKAFNTSRIAETGKLVAAFPVETDDQLMLVANTGQLIRMPVNGIRICGRTTKGVIIFNVADGERIMSAERISDTSSEEENIINKIPKK